MINYELRSDRARTKYFGEEANRLEQFKQLSYSDFKDSIVAIRNMIPDEDEYGDYDLEGFTAEQMLGKSSSLYPRPEDKDELMEYALGQAQEQTDVQTAALIMGTAMVAIHPFDDGNGRTSRAIYAHLSRGWQKGSKGYGKIRRHEGQELIDFAGVSLEPTNMIKQLIYQETGVIPYANGVNLQRNDFADSPWPAFDSPNRNLLPNVIFMDLGLYDISEANIDAMLFSFSRLAAEGYGPFPCTEDTEGTPRLDLYNAVDQLDLEARAVMLEYAQQYHSLRAKAAIDLIGKYGDLPFRQSELPDITVREYLLVQTKNFLVSAVKQD